MAEYGGVLVRVCIDEIKHYDQRANGGTGKRIYLAYTSTLMFTTKEIRTGTHTEQEPGGRS